MSEILKLPPELIGPPPDPKPAPERHRAPVAAAKPFPKLAKPARFQFRHRAIATSLALTVALPVLMVAAYLYLFAIPQFASTVAFSVREEDSASSLDLLAGLTELSGSASKDADILYSYIQSQQIVERIHAKSPLHPLWQAPGDPVFGLGKDASIEGLQRYWNRMVRVFYDSTSGLIEVRVLAFDPGTAQHVAQQILDESRHLVTNLADVARADSTRHASANLSQAQAQLRHARNALTQFRSENQILDPEADLAGRMGLLNSLEAQQAEALIEYDLLTTSNTRPGDPRLELAERRVAVVAELISQERARFGAEENSLSALIGTYERLSVDLEFAQTAYVAARASFDAAQADARRTTKYLAAHIEPTLAQRAQYPRRLMWLALITMTLVMFWAIALLIYYSVRDRR